MENGSEISLFEEDDFEDEIAELTLGKKRKLNISEITDGGQVFAIHPSLCTALNNPFEMCYCKTWPLKTKNTNDVKWIK